MTIVIAEDALNLANLGRLVPTIGEVDFSETGATGPLRRGGRGRDDFRITANVHLHRTEQFPHYHFDIRATAADEGITPPRHVPTTGDFFDAIAAGLSNPEGGGIVVQGEHYYPRSWWKGAVELPVPVSIPGEKQTDAELTGVEVSYKVERGTERVSVSLQEDTFTASTWFLTDRIDTDLFETALRRSATVAGRLFDENTRSATDDE